MITKEQERTVVTNVNNSSGFQIQNNAKMFSILSSGIYADPIRAIIRELSCNAYDSHIDAGKKDEPFHVRLPSRFDPKLQIEDFGIGLDHDGITNVYTTYGMSTKTDSNDVIGALGLGSKTPFSYAETFSIRARKDGIERWYNAYIGNEGFPTISLLSERETDEHNGLMIEVAVKDTDCSRFREKAQYVFKSFKNVPDGLPDSMGDAIRAKSEAMYEAFEQDGFYVDRSCDRGIYAVMGNIAYRVPDNLIETARDGLDQFLRSRFGVGYCIYLPFDIGELDIAANRETLSFSETDDDPTYMAILAKLDGTLGVYLEQVQEDLDACPTWVEACQYISKSDLRMVAGMFTYQGVPMDHVRTQRINLNQLFHHRTVWSTTAFNQHTRVKYETRVHDENGRYTNDPNLRNREIAASDGLVVIYNDKEESRGVPTAIRWYVSNYGIGKHVIGVKNAISKDVMKRLKERVPNVEFKAISPIIAERKAEMEKNRSTTTQAERYQKDTEVKARSFDGNGNCKLACLDIETLRNMGQRVVYYRPPDARIVTIWTILGKQIDISGLNKSMLRFMGIDLVVYANQTNMKRIMDNNIPNIEDVIKTKIPLMKRMVEAKKRIKNVMRQHDYLHKIVLSMDSRGTKRNMDQFAVDALFDHGYIKHDDTSSVSKEMRLLQVIGARYFTGPRTKMWSLERRLEHGAEKLNSNFFVCGTEIVNALVDDNGPTERPIEYTIAKYAKLADKFIEDNPMVEHFDPKFNYYDVSGDIEGSEDFLNMMKKMVDNWTPTSV